MDNQKNDERSLQAQAVLERLEEIRAMKRDGVAPAVALPLCDAIMEKWGPMAEHIGMRPEQREMLDLAVAVGYPDDYKELKRLLFESEAMCENVFKVFALPIRSMLDTLGIEYTFKYRMKSVYSIWRKMRVDHKQFDDVYDLFAARIVYKPKPVVEPIGSVPALEAIPEVATVKNQTLSEIDPEHLYCWRIYTVIASLYRMQQDRIKNWITHPKPSGYQALQMTVMGPDCNWIELQIRSERMDYEAEHGSASHWMYKNEKSVK